MTTRIFVPCDAASRAVGADKVAAAILDEARHHALDLEIVRTGSRGLFLLEPMIEVQTPGGRVAFGPVAAKNVPSLFAGGLPAPTIRCASAGPRTFPSSSVRRASPSRAAASRIRFRSPTTAPMAAIAASSAHGVWAQPAHWKKS